MQIQALTFEQLVLTVAVLLLMLGIYNTTMAAVKTHREEIHRRKEPVTSLEMRINDHEAKLKNDNARLKVLEDGNRIMMRAMMAMLSHDINGNSDEALKKSLQEINEYLIDK